MARSSSEILHVHILRPFVRDASGWGQVKPRPGVVPTPQVFPRSLCAPSVCVAARLGIGLTPPPVPPKNPQGLNIHE